ncbi:MAG: TerD family protein [Oscillospiraceae bacterium]|nr:TerD family protein [Oscillospiraceae bacterium]
MSVNLQKGQKVDLTKGNAGLKTLVVGLGWDEAPKKFSLFGKRDEDIDCDASALLINTNSGKLSGPVDVVYYGQLMHRSGAVRHCGDNLTGAGDGDDEQIIVELTKVPADFSKIVFVVTIYQAVERRQNFGMIRNAFIRIVDADNGTELCKYNLSENYDGKTAMIFGEVYRYNNEWKFGAIGEPTNDNGIAQIAARFQ